MALYLSILFISLLYFTYAQLNQCGFKCAQCDFLGNCLNCEQGFFVNQESGNCQSSCSQKSFYLNSQEGVCEPICGYGYQESDEYYICIKNQKCPLIREFGNELKEVVDATLVGTEFIVFSVISPTQQYFIRIYDSDLKLKGEVQQLSDQIKKYVLDEVNNVFITCSKSEINFWEVKTWKVIRKILISAYVQNTKNVIYLDQDVLILQDQSERQFSIIYITQAFSNNQALKFKQFFQPTQKGPIQIFKGINKIFFRLSSDSGFFERSLLFDSPVTEISQYCKEMILTSSLAPLSDDYVLFGTSNNNLGIWKRGVDCSTQNIQATSQIILFQIISRGSLDLPVYVIAAEQTQYYELTSKNTQTDLSLVRKVDMNSTFYMDFKQNNLLIRNNQTYNVQSYVNSQLVQTLSGNSQSPDNQSFKSLQYFNNYLYQFYINSMFISQPSQNQVIQYQLNDKKENINYYQPNPMDTINQFVLDPNYEGQLIVASDDGAIRVYESSNDEDSSYVQLFAQYHPSCNQDLFKQLCFSVKNISVSDFGYYYGNYVNNSIKFITVWQRNVYSLKFIGDFYLDNNLNFIQNYQLRQNYLLVQSQVQIKIFDITTKSILVDDKRDMIYYATFDQLWGNPTMIIYLLSDRLSVRKFTSTTPTYEKLYSSIYAAKSYYQLFRQAQYFNSLKVLAFHNYYNVIVFNLTNQTSPTFYSVNQTSLRSFCYHPANGYTLIQNLAFKQLVIGDQKGNIMMSQIISGFINATCGSTPQNIFYYYVTPLVASLQNTVFVMTMPNFEMSHVLSFKKFIKYVLIDESQLILYVGFDDGDIYASQIILNFRINLNNYSNVAQFIYAQKKNYFIIYQTTNVMIVDSKTLLLIKQFSTPNQNKYTLVFNEDLDIIILYQATAILQWRIDSGQLDQYPIFHLTPIIGCYIDPQKGLLVSQSQDNQIYVWDILKVSMLDRISYHADDLSTITDQTSIQAQTFQIYQILMLQDIHYLITSNSLNRIYFHNLVENIYFKMQIQSDLKIIGLNYDSLYQYLYIVMMSDFSFIDVLAWQNSLDISKSFQFKKRIIGSQNKIELNTAFKYDWSFIYEKRSMMVLNRYDLTTFYSFDTFNPQISNFLVSYNLRQIIFWSDCSVDFCSPKVPIYSIDTGLKISEVPYDQQTEQGMIISVMLDEDTNSIITFKQGAVKIIVIFDLVNFATVGLFSNLKDVFTLPLKSYLLIKETANIIFYSGTTISSYQIENMLAPTNPYKSILPNRVQKFKYTQDKSLFFYDSKSQSWLFDQTQEKFKNVLSSNSISYLSSIRYFFQANNFMFVLYKDFMTQVDSNYQVVASSKIEIDKALLLQDLIIITNYAGSVTLFDIQTLKQQGSIISVGERAKIILHSQSLKEVFIFTYKNKIFRVNYNSMSSQQWFSPSTENISKIYFDQGNKILLITITNGKIYLFDEQKILDSNPINPTANSIQLTSNSNLIYQLSIDPLQGKLGVFLIPPNAIPQINFYSYVFTDETKQSLSDIKLIGSIPCFSRSPQLKIQYIKDKIFVFSAYQIIQYNSDLKQVNIFRSTQQFINVKKILEVDSPQPDIFLFFVQQENKISLFSQQNTTLIQLYTHSCITPNIISYKLLQTNDGYNVNLLILCDEKVINDSIYLENLLSPLSQLSKCYAESKSSLQYEQLQQTDFGNYITNRNISFSYRNMDSNSANVLILKENTFSDYQFEGLKIQSFLFDMSQLLSALQFSQKIKEIAFYNIILDFSKASKDQSQKSQILFSNMDKVIISELSLNNFDLNRDTPLLVFSNIQEVIIDSIVFDKIKIMGSDATLMHFYNIQSLSIFNLMFTNLDISVSQNSQLIYFEFVRNLNIQTSKFESIISSYQMPLILIKGVKKTILTNIQFIDIDQVSFLSSYNFYNIQESRVLVSLNEAILNNLIVKNIKQISNSLIYFNQTSIINISLSQFSNIYCLSCNGGALQIYQGDNHQISSSRFIQIISQKGGALSILECPSSTILIQDSSFLENQASISGGAIFLQNSNVVIQSTTIMKNSAMVGGGIRYTEIKPIINNFSRILEQSTSSLLKENRIIQQGNNNIIGENKAQIFGNNIGSYLQQLIIIQPTLDKLDIKELKGQYNEQQISKQFVISSYKLSHFRSGDNIDLAIQLLDEEDNPISFNKDMVNNAQYDSELLIELKALQVKVEPMNNSLLKVFGKYTSDYSQFDSQKKAFIIQGMIIVSNPETSNNIRISSESLIKIDKVSRKIDQENTNKLFGLLNVETRRCVRGEVYQLVDQVYQCYVCQEGTYFLDEPQKDGKACLKCPIVAEQCHNNYITLKSGYWRSDNSTDNIISCSRNPDNCVPNEEKGYCIQGHYGPLCEQCDVYGKVWGQPYITNGNFECYPCKNLKRKPYYTYLIINILIMMIFIVLSISQSLYNSKCIVISYYLRKMNLLSISKSAFWNSSCFGLKILTNYLQLSALIFIQLQQQFPSGVRILSSTLGMPSTNLFYSLDCKFSQFEQMSIVYIRTMWSLAIPLAYFIFVSLILMSYGRMRKHSIKTLLINGAVYLFFFTQNNIVYLLLSMMSCRKINNNYYIVSDITYECFTPTHLKFMKFIGIPGLITWIILIPLFIFKTTKKRQNEQEYALFRQKFGYLYNDYKKEFFYWDFFKSYKKIIITSALTLYTDPIGLCLQLIYLMALRKYNPYFNQSFYYVELFAETMLVFLFFISIGMSQNVDSSNTIQYTIFISLSAFTEGYMFLWTLKQYIKTKFLVQYAQFKEYLLKTFSFFQFFTTLIVLNNGIRHLTVWKRARRLLIEKQFTENEQNLFQSQYMKESKQDFLFKSSIFSQENMMNSQGQLITEGEKKGQAIKYRQSIFDRIFPGMPQSQPNQMLKNESLTKLIFSPKQSLNNTNRKDYQQSFINTKSNFPISFNMNSLTQSKLQSAKEGEGFINRSPEDNQIVGKKKQNAKKPIQFQLENIGKAVGKLERNSEQNNYAEQNSPSLLLKGYQKENKYKEVKRVSLELLQLQPLKNVSRFQSFQQDQIQELSESLTESKNGNELSIQQINMLIEDEKDDKTISLISQQSPDMHDEIYSKKDQETNYLKNLIGQEQISNQFTINDEEDNLENKQQHQINNSVDEESQQNQNIELQFSEQLYSIGSENITEIKLQKNNQNIGELQNMIELIKEQSVKQPQIEINQNINKDYIQSLYSESEYIPQLNLNDKVSSIRVPQKVDEDEVYSEQSLNLISAGGQKQNSSDNENQIIEGQDNLILFDDDIED